MPTEHRVKIILGFPGRGDAFACWGLGRIKPFNVDLVSLLPKLQKYGLKGSLSDRGAGKSGSTHQRVSRATSGRDLFEQIAGKVDMCHG